MKTLQVRKQETLEYLSTAGISEFWFKRGTYEFFKGIVVDGDIEFRATEKNKYSIKKFGLDSQEGGQTRSWSNKPIKNGFEFIDNLTRKNKGGGFFGCGDPSSPFPLKPYQKLSTQVITEIDDLPRDEQLKLYQSFSEVTGLTPYLISSGGKSIHLHILLNEPTSMEKVIYLRRLLCLALDGDPMVTRPHQPFRFPWSYRKEKGNYQEILQKGKAYSYDEVLKGLKTYFDYVELTFPSDITDSWWSCLERILNSDKVNGARKANPITKEEKLDNLKKALDEGLTKIYIPLDDSEGDRTQAKSNKIHETKQERKERKIRTREERKNRDERSKEAVKIEREKIDYLLTIIPPRITGSGTYELYRILFKGIANILGNSEAIALAYRHSPNGGDWQQYIESSSGNFGWNTIIKTASEWGFNPDTDQVWKAFNLKSKILEEQGKPPLFDAPWLKDSLNYLVNILYPWQNQELGLETIIPIDSEELGLKPITPINSEDLGLKPIIPIDSEELGLKPITPIDSEELGLKPIIPMDSEDPEKDIRLNVFGIVKNYLGFTEAVKLAKIHCPDVPEWDGKLAEYWSGEQQIGSLIFHAKKIKGWVPEDDKRWLELQKDVFKHETLKRNKKYSIFSPDHLIDNRFISDAIVDDIIKNDIDFNNLIYAIKSPKGTGKSYFLSNILREWIQNQPIVVVCNRVELLGSLSKELGLTSVEAMLDNGGFLETAINNGQSLAVCIDSLWRLSNHDLSNYFIICDEAESTTDSLLNSKTYIKKVRPLVWSTLSKIATNSKGIILLDADLTDTAVNYWKDISGFATRKILNTYNPFHRKLYPYTGKGSEEAFSYQLRQDLSVGKNIFLIADSCTAAHAFYEFYKDKYKTVCYSAPNLGNNPDLRRFIKNKGQAIKDENIQLFIATPAIQSGISIELDDYFDSVYGYFVGVSTPDIARQMLGRDRSNCDRHVLYRKVGIGYSADYDPEKILKNDTALTNELLESVSYVATVQNLTNDQATELVKQYITNDSELKTINQRYQSIYKARTNIQKRYYGELLMEGLEAEGYELCTPQWGNDDCYKAIKEKKEELILLEAQRFFDAPLIGEMKAQELKHKMSRNDKERAMLNKFYFNQRCPNLLDKLTIEVIVDEIFKNGQETIQGIENYYFANNPEVAHNLSVNKISARVAQSHKSGIFQLEGNQPAMVARLWDLIGGDSFLEMAKFDNDTARSIVMGWGNVTRCLLRNFGVRWSKSSKFVPVIRKVALLFGHTIEALPREHGQSRQYFITENHKTLAPVELDQTKEGITWDTVLWSITDRYSEKIELKKDYFDDMINDQKSKNEPRKNEGSIINGSIRDLTSTGTPYNKDEVCVSAVSVASYSFETNSPSEQDYLEVGNNLNNQSINNSNNEVINQNLRDCSENKDRGDGIENNDGGDLTQNQDKSNCLESYHKGDRTQNQDNGNCLENYQRGDRPQDEITDNKAVPSPVKLSEAMVKGNESFNHNQLKIGATINYETEYILGGGHRIKSCGFGIIKDIFTLWGDRWLKLSNGVEVRARTVTRIFS
ncbi:plasmid replication protein, CyRepA1 family (plasmid) [Cyanobacterium sp. IPPAS B-1200]|uniref:plasmid replication protein, CyRepA1 family n=1 Tax=Cyanobacterium sp. IPPAS B-1200 TaxID=1562720 RepID=UPI0008527143|nr:plasmid replication protein, CyRepA1 family [Cyanobacterium sp. IPPAS B-1200]OEJ78387.1 hypothetical protein A5482_13570 [Cyanobacterium sp. IPPAS B-1200]